ncbi:MAG: hypothetical protein LBC73_07185 [Oscillospiraceae bacterium]|nr:hypothetical protein [Oscillospiraceae bacterium]
MMKRTISTLMSLLLLFLFTFGCSYNSGWDTTHESGQRIVHTTIAVVNMDLGVEVYGERQNYSAAIINTLDKDYVLVSAGIAESGFESGAYGAVITFPSNVSERILSFNSNRPERVELEFQVSRDLSEADYIDTHLKIMNLQVSINTTIAQTYVSSMFLQFHNAQNHLELVFNNNLDNLTSIDAIRLPAFTSSLALDRLPEIPLETEGTDTSQHTITVANFAEMVSGVYLNSYEAASQSYLSMREGLYGLIDELPRQEDYWMDKLAAWAMVKIEYSDELDGFTEKLMDYADELDAWLENMYDWYDDATDWHTEIRNSYNVAILYINEVSEYVEILSNSINPVLSELQEIYELLNSAYDLTDDETALLLLGEIISIINLDNLTLSTFYELFDEMPDNSMLDFPNEFDLRIPPSNLTPAFTELPPTKPTNLQPPRPDDFWKSLNSLQTQLSEFNIDEFLSDDVHRMVLGFLRSFDDFLGFLSNDMDRQFDINLLELYNIRLAYIDYLSDLREGTLQGEADEQDRLRDDLSNIIFTHETNHNNTYAMLSDFAGMMPESRRPTGMNRELIDFTVAPFEFVSLETRLAKLNTEVIQERSDAIALEEVIIIVVVAVLVISLIAILAVNYRKNKLKK